MQRKLVACVTGLFALAAAPAAHAQYTAPAPDPGFRYIFDGTATGADSSFDKWAFAAGTAAQSRPASQGGQGQATLNTATGAIDVGASPFGAYWYPVKAFGDATFRIQYTVQDTPTSTPNGGVMIRTPEIRYTGANTTEVLAQKPTGFNFDVCPGAIPLCGLTAPAPSTTYKWPGSTPNLPPAFEYTGGYCARQTAAGVYNVNGLNGQPLTVNGNANNHQHWTQVACGHEVQINESLTGGGPQPSTDPIKTGSIYNFRNLNAKQSGTAKRLVKGVWHEMEIRTIGQQYTVLVDGQIINQFDNSIPKTASRAGDPPTMARQLAAGYLGLQTHGGNDRISYREMQVKEFAAADLPVNTTAPSVSGTGFQGQALRCNHGAWNAAAGSTRWVTWYAANKIPENHPRFRAPNQLDYNNTTTPAETEHGTSALTWLDAQIVGTGDTYTPTAAEVGKSVYCQVSVDNAGATVFKTALAPEIITATNVDVPVGGSVSATLALSLGAPATFAAFTPGVTKNYDADAAVTVTSTAGNATLSVADPGANPGHLVNGAFSLPQALQARGSASGAFADLGASPLVVRTYTGPVSGDTTPVTYRQRIASTDALRTGTYSKTLTLTLATTEP
ncbi:DUF1080 domain-containing protein [Solirubrobacter phytolaccae]|uniref:DUF1080 domain-containing protein n=1 Tax=Solirubrobacter phytolaccae TaxID=1404360 RepID=A0A9X3NBC2_9ACTN|nr:DUF1080 domain-containing protein [Solirubrobacter phytolaccae]MDA0183475.1 DUF1080 domain-containing protein [Solirubrobacter phytolaccae]